jgi:hypothetical protein
MPKFDLSQLGMSEFGGDDPKRWRALEDGARDQAGKMKDQAASRIMLEVADNYRKLAEYAERRRARSMIGTI